jgi:hypothetical protein
MEHFDDSWDEVAGEPEFEADSDPEALWRSLVADEAYPRYWSDSVWSHDAENRFGSGALLFVDRDAEAELGDELRLAELWGLCETGRLAMDEFAELSGLIAKVHGLPGSPCVDCGMLHRPNVSANWALATTTLCRAHLRFRLHHARIDGDSTRR